MSSHAFPSHQLTNGPELEAEVSSGRLVAVLEDFAAPPNGTHAVFPGAKHLPLRVRLWIDFLKDCYGHPDFWRTQV